MISLVLATLGRTGEIARLFDSLVAQTDQRFEVIVVDQNPDNRLVCILEQGREMGLPINHLRQSEPNLSAARNLGVHHANGEFVGFPDDDCWYEPQVVEEVLAAFSSHPGWNGVVAQWVELANFGTEHPSGTLLSSDEWRRLRGGNASSIALFIKAELFKQAGCFDARLGVGQWFGAGEETDFILTSLSAGGMLAHWPSARVHHAYGSVASRLASSNWHAVIQRERGTGALYVKHRLAWGVILRGLLAPPIKALCHCGIRGLWLGLAISAGRLQGALAWKIREG